jgi:hypothetical protein
MTEDVDRPDHYGIIGRFFRNPLLWIGFGIAVFIQMMNGLNLYFPDVPRMLLSLDTGPMLRDAPWNQIHFAGRPKPDLLSLRHHRLRIAGTGREPGSTAIPVATLKFGKGRFPHFARHPVFGLPPTSGRPKSIFIRGDSGCLPPLRHRSDIKAR